MKVSPAAAILAVVMSVVIAGVASHNLLIAEQTSYQKVSDVQCKIMFRFSVINPDIDMQAP